MKWEIDDSDVNKRPVGIYFQNGIFELPQDNDLSTALVEIEGCDRSGFMNTHFAQEAGLTPPCIILGGSSVVHDIDGLSFAQCYWQHSQTGPQFAIVTGDNIDNVSIIAPVASVLNSKFINATATTSGAIMVVGGNVDVSEHTDPNSIITTVGGNGVQVGLQPATAGARMLIDPKKTTTSLKLVARDASNAQRHVELGVGTDKNLVTLTDIFLRMPPQATAPTNPSSGTLAISTGASGGFDGSSGEGLYRRNNANSAWVFVG